MIPFVITIAVFFYIDSIVADWIQGKFRVPSGIYSESEDLFDRPRSFAERALLARDYIELQENPDEPGEFKRTETGLLIFKRNSEAPILWEPGDSLLLEPRLLIPFGEQKDQTPIPLNQMPAFLKDAFISIEDERFYSHSGIDLIGISRAFFANIKAMRFEQGGSTITQQLAKNVFFSRKRSLIRKFLEVFAAFSIELRLSKDRILEKYLNEIYFGQEGSVAIHGVGSAASYFFNKQVNQLTLAESALLAGMIQAPSYFNPKKHLSRARTRRDLVLKKMLELSKITESDFATAGASKITITKREQDKRIAPFYVDTLRKNLPEGELVVYSGLTLQECGESAISEGISELSKTYPALRRRELQAALVAIDSKSGLVRSYVGGKDYRVNQFDRISEGKRQIGSTIKPFIYLSALDKNLNNYKVATLASILSDEPISIELSGGKYWSPENYDNSFRGDVTLRYALEKSLNIPAVQITRRVGVKTIARVLSDFGLTDSPPLVPSIALGAVEASLLSLTGAYAGLASGGKFIKPTLFKEAIVNGERMTPEIHNEKRVASEGAVFLITDALRGVIERGTGRSVKNYFKGQAAGKTGTTNDAKDAWFVGYTPDITAGVWVGFDKKDSIGLTGGVAAAPIWGRFMNCAQDIIKLSTFVQPKEVISMWLDPYTLEPVEPGTFGSTRELFIAGTERF